MRIIAVLITVIVVRGLASECSPHALSSISIRLFEKKDVRCATKSGPDELCDLKFLWPTSVTCIRPDNGLPSPWTPRSMAGEYALGAWRCHSDRSWVQYSSMVCEGNQTACETMVRDSCHAEFDPSMALAYILLLVLGCVFAFGCICCTAACGYMVHCMCAYGNERRYVYSRLP